MAAMFHQVMDWTVKKQNTQALNIDLAAIQLAIELYFVNVTEVRSKQFYKPKPVNEK
jgi:hypothetical protein